MCVAMDMGSFCTSSLKCVRLVSSQSSNLIASFPGNEAGNAKALNAS